jgi:hypothetical protein
LAATGTGLRSEEAGSGAYDLAQQVSIAAGGNKVVEEALAATSQSEAAKSGRPGAGLGAGWTVGAAAAVSNGTLSLHGAGKDAHGNDVLSPADKQRLGQRERTELRVPLTARKPDQVTTASGNLQNVVEGLQNEDWDKLYQGVIYGAELHVNSQQGNGSAQEVFGKGYSDIMAHVNAERRRLVAQGRAQHAAGDYTAASATSDRLDKLNDHVQKAWDEKRAFGGNSDKEAAATAPPPGP